MTSELHTPAQLEMLDRMRQDLGRYGVQPATNHWGSDEARQAEYQTKAPIPTSTPTDEEACRNGMTQKQLDYIISLCTALQPAIGRDEIVRYHAGLSKGSASARITVLIERRNEAKAAGTLLKPQAQPKAAAGAKQTVTNSDAKVTQDGIYRNPNNGHIYKVQIAHHGSGQLYAKQLLIDDEGKHTEDIPLDAGRKALEFGNRQVRTEWVYKPGLVNKIKPEWRMSFDQAKTYGKLYGECLRCHRVLTREDSIERSMGPVCSRKENWAY